MKRRRLPILLILVVSCLLIFSCINVYGFDLGEIDASASREKADDDREDSPDAQVDYTGVAALLKLSPPSLDHQVLTFHFSCFLPALPILFSASILRC